jgi:hypothetical protein
MDNKNYFFPAFIIVILLFTAARPSGARVMNNDHSIRTGVTFTDFILGMKDDSIYNLSDIVGKRFIVLAFLDSSIESSRLKKQITGAVTSISGSKPGLLWLNIVNDKEHVEISEQTHILNLRYRTLSENIPKVYSFPARPAILIIDPRGIIQFIYVGYSPTILDDLKNWLMEAK